MSRCLCDNLLLLLLWSWGVFIKQFEPWHEVRLKVLSRTTLFIRKYVLCRTFIMNLDKFLSIFIAKNSSILRWKKVCRMTIVTRKVYTRYSSQRLSSRGNIFNREPMKKFQRCRNTRLGFSPPKNITTICCSNVDPIFRPKWGWPTNSISKWQLSWSHI